jgi:hypothetical protein
VYRTGESYLQEVQVYGQFLGAVNILQKTTKEQEKKEFHYVIK